jgi:rubrerythrin
MRRMLLVLMLALTLVVTACGTPVQVQQLSRAQIGYFDTAIKAVKLQSETLVLAAEKIKEQAEARIAENERQNLKDLQKVVAETIPSMQEDQRRSAAEQMLKKTKETSQAAVNARTKLANDLKVIKARTQELQAYIAKMKEVQETLDAYLQSKQLGEQLLTDTLKQPTVKDLIDTVNKLLPKVTGAAETVKTLLGGLDMGG